MRTQGTNKLARRLVRQVLAVGLMVLGVGGATGAAEPPPAGRLQSFRDCRDCPDMVIVKGGSFRMGSPADDPERSDDEGPQHLVTIGYDFAVGRYEVTRGQFRSFARETGHRGQRCFGETSFGAGTWGWNESADWEAAGYPQQDDHPVVCVSWDDAQAYVKWLSRRTGQKYRLLSEAEWEYAARAGTTSARFWGTGPDESCAFANGSDLTARDQYFAWIVSNCRDGHVYTAPVGTFRPNAFGLNDLMGNVWEWVEDCWNQTYDGAPTDGSAWTTGTWTTGTCATRVMRGGSWSYVPSSMRSPGRDWFVASNRDFSNGFRVARTMKRRAGGGDRQAGARVPSGR